MLLNDSPVLCKRLGLFHSKEGHSRWRDREKKKKCSLSILFLCRLTMPPFPRSNTNPSRSHSTSGPIILQRSVPIFSHFASFHTVVQPSWTSFYQSLSFLIHRVCENQSWSATAACEHALFMWCPHPFLLHVGTNDVITASVVHTWNAVVRAFHHSWALF